MNFKLGDEIVFVEDIKSNPGAKLLIPKFTRCKITNINEHMITVFVEATGKFQQVRNVNYRKTPIFHWKEDLTLLKLLYEK